MSKASDATLLRLYSTAYKHALLEIKDVEGINTDKPLYDQIRQLRRILTDDKYIPWPSSADEDE